MTIPNTLSVRSFGPIREGNVTFGDLTVLIGPQASGKSLLVQLYKAICDSRSIRFSLNQYGFIWESDENGFKQFLSLYFGRGMETVWKPGETKVRADGKEIKTGAFNGQVGRPPKRHNESVFLIPAQRVLVLQDGWPKPFMSHQMADPYCLKSFSESLRLLLESGLDKGNDIFPHPKRLKAEFKRLIDKSIYVNGKLKLETDGARKQLVLVPQETGLALRSGSWSAGQREFTPLLLGLYWLIPAAKKTKQDEVQTVIIEEPEMGLHPQAILSFSLLVLELISRGYKVILSTHSPVIVDVVWAITELRNIDRQVAIEALEAMFELKKSGPVEEVLDDALGMDSQVYYFDRKSDGVTIKDISELDPGSNDDAISGWGGLSGFSGKIAQAVGDALEKSRSGKGR